MEYELADYGAGLSVPEPGKNRALCRARKRKLEARDVDGEPPGGPAAVCAEPGAPAALPLGTHGPLIPPQAPFMNNMDEISYWVYTKKAPCLMNFDNQIKKQYELAQGPKEIKSDRSLIDGVASPKKKKRKLSLLDDDCVSLDKHQNIYFEASQHKQRTVLSSCKSETIESDIDFNIKKSSVQNNPKRIKLQKNGRTIHKKNKVVTSTPLRRSLRRVQNGFNDSGLSNMLDVYNCTNKNITDSKHELKASHKSRRCSRKLQITDRNLQKKKDDSNNFKNDTVQNGQFEDLSDVSGFTANYIRSTKVHSNLKQTRNLRKKGSRNLIKESQKTLQKNSSTMVVCVNKSVDATNNPPPCSVLNCSTDSSQNVMNLIMTKNYDRSTKVNRSTSLLKFIDSKSPKAKGISSAKVTNKAELDTTFQSQITSNSRYPKRHKNQSRENMTVSSPGHNGLNRVPSEGRKKSRNPVETNNSERKENPASQSLTRTRSGSNSALANRHPENSVFVYSNSEQVSSVNVINVASPRPNPKVKRLSSHKHAKKSIDQSGISLYKDSVREKSGFTACFSDSDNDSEALKQRKFFC